MPVPALPEFADYDLGLSKPTHFEPFRIYVPWMPFDERGAGCPPTSRSTGRSRSMAIRSPRSISARFSMRRGRSGRLASITGPQTLETAGWLPGQAELPYSIGFENAAGSGKYVNEIRIVTQLDPDLDPRSFQLGDIKIGDITIDVPEGRSNFQGEIDFTATRGFILRVSAVVDLFQIALQLVVRPARHPHPRLPGRLAVCHRDGGRAGAGGAARGVRRPLPQGSSSTPATRSRGARCPAFGAMLSFRARGGREAAIRAVGRARLFIRATSLGRHGEPDRAPRDQRGARLDGAAGAGATLRRPRARRTT